MTVVRLAPEPDHPVTHAAPNTTLFLSTKSCHHSQLLLRILYGHSDLKIGIKATNLIVDRYWHSAWLSLSCVAPSAVFVVRCTVPNDATVPL